MAMSLKESLESLKNQTSAYTPSVMMVNPNTEPKITADMDKRLIDVPPELQWQLKIMQKQFILVFHRPLLMEQI